MLTREDVAFIHGLIKAIREKDFIFPDPGGRGALNAKSKTTYHEFILNVTRGNLNPEQCSYNIRTSENDLLFRVDLNGPAHPNPNGEDIPCPHMHVYKYNGTQFVENWAFPLHEKLPANPEDLVDVLIRFLEYNKAENIPTIIPRMEIEI